VEREGQKAETVEDKRPYRGIVVACCFCIHIPTMAHDAGNNFIAFLIVVAIKSSRQVKTEDYSNDKSEQYYRRDMKERPGRTDPSKAEFQG
jgi:hypothetical protein